MASIAQSLLGGIVIGLAVTVMLLFNGRVTGISGIVASTFSRPFSSWRLMFIAGMFTGGSMMFRFQPEFFANLSGRSSTQVIIAGLLVGFGTVMGSGCTSGHGVCGVSRLSLRSIAATLTFMIFGFLTVQAVLLYVGGQP